MKYVLTAAVLLLAFSMPVQAVNRIMIGLDSLPNCQTEFFVPFLFENDVPLETMVSGFTIEAIGDITALFGTENILSYNGRFNYQMYGYSAGTVPFENIASDTILIAGIFSFYGFDPLPAGPLEILCSHQVLVDKTAPNSEGEICIDSAIIVGAAGDWLWDAGSGNINPSFNDGNGAHCITYYDLELCGDVNHDSHVNVSDAISIINYVFYQGPEPDSYLLGDVNCIDNINISDAVYIIEFIFESGPPPCDTNRDGIPDC